MNRSLTIFDIVCEEDKASLYNILTNCGNSINATVNNPRKENQIEFSCHIQCGMRDNREEVSYELVHFVGYFRSSSENVDIESNGTNRFIGDSDSG